MYNNYLPNYNLYNQNYMNQTQNAQPLYNNQQNMQVQQTQNVQWVQVNGIEGARNHIVQPNQTLWLMDNNEPVFYVKTADNLGTTTLKAYKFTEISDKINSQSLSNITDINLSDYVKKSEIDEIIANKINQIAKEEMKK